MPKASQGKKSKRNSSSGRAEIKRRKTTNKGDTGSRTTRPSRTLSPTLSDTERQARQAVVLMDLETIQKYFIDNGLTPPSTTFKTDWADVYASASAVRRLSGLDPLPPLPQAKAFNTPKRKKRKGAKRKTPSQPKKGGKKEKNAKPPPTGTPSPHGSEAANPTLRDLAKLTPAQREEAIKALLVLRREDDKDRGDDKDRDDGHGLGPNPAAGKEKTLFVDASTPTTSDASESDDEGDEGEDLGGNESSDDKRDLHGEDKKKSLATDEQLASQVKDFFSQMTKAMQDAIKSVQPDPQAEDQDPSRNLPRENAKDALPPASLPKGTPPHVTPPKTPPPSLLPPAFGPGGPEAAWKQIPGARTDSTATKQWARIYDAAKKAVTASAPAPIIAWRRVTHDLQMWNRLSDLDHQSGDGFLLNFNPSGSDPFKVSKRSRQPPKITSWTALWEAFDNRAATICVFFPGHAGGTITDRTTLKSLQDGGLAYSAAEEWINTAMFKANAPCKPLGPLDSETMLKLLTTKTVSPSPNPRPRGQDTRQTGKKQTPSPATSTKGPSTTPPASAKGFHAALRTLVLKTHRDTVNTHSLCRNFNLGNCDQDDQHATTSNPNRKLVHKCCVCLQDHPASACPDAGLPTP